MILLNNTPLSFDQTSFLIDNIVKYRSKQIGSEELCSVFFSINDSNIPITSNHIDELIRVSKLLKEFNKNNVALFYLDKKATSINNSLSSRIKLKFSKVDYFVVDNCIQVEIPSFNIYTLLLRVLQDKSESSSLFELIHDDFNKCFEYQINDKLSELYDMYKHGGLSFPFFRRVFLSFLSKTESIANEVYIHYEKSRDWSSSWNLVLTNYLDKSLEIDNQYIRMFMDNYFEYDNK